MDNAVVGQILNILDKFNHAPSALQNDIKGMVRLYPLLTNVYSPFLKLPEKLLSNHRLIFGGKVLRYHTNRICSSQYANANLLHTAKVCNKVYSALPQGAPMTCHYKLPSQDLKV